MNIGLVYAFAALHAISVKAIFADISVLVYV